MTNVHEALKKALEALTDVKIEHGIDYRTARDGIESALAEIEASEKCEPSATVMDAIDGDGNVLCHGLNDLLDTNLPQGTKLFTSPKPIEREVPESIKELIRNQQPLPADMQKILYDNLFDLYESPKPLPVIPLTHEQLNTPFGTGRTVQREEPTDGIKLAWQAATAEHDKRVKELQASINTLREALETIATESHYELWQVQVATKALQSTPAESLKSHDDELIEKCAVRGRLAQLESKVVDVEIRALKGKHD